MIPIVSTNGKIIAFGGRSTNSSEPKYLNSPESDVFSKRNILFGAYNVKKRKQNIDSIILCEGYMDVIALFRFGYPAVATLGTAVSEKQIDLLTKLSKNIFIKKDWELAHLLLASLLFTFSEPVRHSLQLSVLLLSVLESPMKPAPL